MEFVETSLFSGIRENYFDDEQFHRLQLFLLDRPDAGNVIQGSGGVRKLRWGLQRTGKRGGARVIYYWMSRDSQILFLTVYTKNEAKDLSAETIAAMRALVKEL